MAHIHVKRKPPSQRLRGPHSAARNWGWARKAAAAVAGRSGPAEAAPRLAFLEPPREGLQVRQIHDPDDLKEAIARVDTELRYQYLIGYQPSIKHWQWKGKFREVRLETRRGSLSVRTRKGYYAMP